MPEVIATTGIAAPPDEVWALICTPERYPEFADPADRMLSVPDGDFGRGSVYREYGGVPPFKAESTWRVTAFEPVRRQVHVGDDGSMTLDLTIELTPIDTGTRLTQTLALTPRWYLRPVFAVLWPLFMRKRAQQAMDRTVQNVRRIVEASRSAPSAADAPFTP